MTQFVDEYNALLCEYEAAKVSSYCPSTHIIRWGPFPRVQ